MNRLIPWSHSYIRLFDSPFKEKVALTRKGLAVTTAVVFTREILNHASNMPQGSITGQAEGIIYR